MADIGGTDVGQGRGDAVVIAADLLSAILSFQTWEQLTSECGWSTGQYIEAMKTTLHRSLVKPD